MTLQRLAPATPLGRTVDLNATRNAGDAELAAVLHPLYGPALERLPDGPAVFRGLPFALAPRSAERRWVVVDEPVTIDLGGASRAGSGDGDTVSHVVVAHFADSWRDAAGDRPPGMPVGWVLPTGEPLATYELAFTDGRTRAIAVRRRFEVADGIIGWGFLPFEAVGHRSDAPVDWRGPHPIQSPGRYPAAGHAGPLGMLPAAWGPAQTGVADFVPTPDDDITLWLHAIPLAPGEVPVRLRLIPLGNGRPGSAVVVAAVSLFHGTANPLVATPRRQLRIEGSGGELPEVDLGVAIRGLPPARTAADDDGTADREPTGWGRPRSAAMSRTAGTATLVDLAATPDARIRVGDWTLPLAELDRTGSARHERTVIRALPAANVRVDVRVTADGTPTPARVRFVAADGRYLAPLGHRDEVNPGLMEDSGADVVLGSDTYAYVGDAFQIDLPPGPVEVEAVKGFDHRPIRTRLDVAAGRRELTLDLERAIDLRGDGWLTSDSHVHYIAPSTALLQAAAEDVAFVHLLATQAGDDVTNGQDLAWGSQRDPAGRHAVIVGTENRQNLLGHLALLGARRPVLPMASGGAPEGRLGGVVDELLGDWADRCRAAGGLVVGAHFPLPYAEIASDIVSGRIDAVEMQVFAPGLDSPPILEWYRFLNCGYRLPVLGGTDKMSAEVPVGAIRTYARLVPDEPPTFDAWAAAVRAGRTFATSGPVLELAVDGHEPGDTIGLPRAGGRLEVRARARAAQPVIGSLEVVMNGRLVAREDVANPVADLRLAATVEVTAGAWIAARSRSGFEVRSAFATTMAAHTSPVYVEVQDRPLFEAADADAIVEVIDGTARWLALMAAVADPAERRRMVARITASGTTLRERMARTKREDA